MENKQFFDPYNFNNQQTSPANMNFTANNMPEDSNFMLPARIKSYKFL